MKPIINVKVVWNSKYAKAQTEKNENEIWKKHTSSLLPTLVYPQ